MVVPVEKFIRTIPLPIVSFSRRVSMAEVMLSRSLLARLWWTASARNAAATDWWGAGRAADV
jgi:hypothetical protein